MRVFQADQYTCMLKPCTICGATESSIYRKSRLCTASVAYSCQAEPLVVMRHPKMHNVERRQLSIWELVRVLSSTVTVRILATVAHSLQESQIYSSLSRFSLLAFWHRVRHDRNIWEGRDPSSTSLIQCMYHMEWGESHNHTVL